MSIEQEREERARKTAQEIVDESNGRLDDRFIAFIVLRFGQHGGSKSYFEEWRDRIKYHTAWANADKETKKALLTAGYKKKELMR